MVFVLSFYDQGHRHYGLFYGVMQNNIKLMPVPWRQTVRNDHIILCVFILFTSKEDQKILYILANQFI